MIPAALHHLDVDHRLLAWLGLHSEVRQALHLADVFEVQDAAQGELAP